MSTISKYAEQGYVDALAHFGLVEKDAGAKDIAKKVIDYAKTKGTQAKFIASGAKDEAAAAGQNIKEWAGKHKGALIPAAAAAGGAAVGAGATGLAMRKGKKDKE